MDKRFIFLKIVFYNFYFDSRAFICISFFDPSPHRQQVGSATLPQGESDGPVSFTNAFIKYMFSSQKWWRFY